MRFGEPFQHVAVVGDEQQAAGTATELALEPVDGVDVEVVGRLVQDEQVRGSEQRAGERDPASLPPDIRDAGWAGSTPTRSSSASASCSGRWVAVEHDLQRGRVADRRVLGSQPIRSPLRGTTSPASGSRSPATIRSSVVFPDPLGPTTPTRSSEVSPKEASAKRVRPSTDAVTRSTETRCTRGRVGGGGG
jgi:hypothetical protein